MLPLIGGFIVSLAGSFLGKAIANAWENSKAQAAKTTAPDAPAPFASVLAHETQRVAQAPGAAVTDARLGSAVPLPPASPHFGSAGRVAEEPQAP